MFANLVAPLPVPIGQFLPQKLRIWLLSQLLKNGCFSSSPTRVNGSGTSVSNMACGIINSFVPLSPATTTPKLHPHIHPKGQPSRPNAHLCSLLLSWMECCQEKTMTPSFLSSASFATATCKQGRTHV